MSHASDLSQILSAMGNAAGDVAQTLRAARIQGVRNAVRFLNPIVRYCQAQLRVDDYALDVMRPNILCIKLPKNKSEDVPLPSAVEQFLAAFNEGAYPDLELPPS